MECSRCTLGPKKLKVECPFKTGSQSKAKSFEGCRSSVRMTMHKVVHEMVVRECYEPNSKRSGVAWKAYMNARVASLFLLVLLEYPNEFAISHSMEARESNRLIQMMDDSRCTLDLKWLERVMDSSKMECKALKDHRKIALDDDDDDIHSLDSRSFQEGKAMD
ncbi:hypothetical protein Tco_0915567 [Tanacetum coccineum]